MQTEQIQSNDSNTIWLEKYRPKVLDEVQGNDDSIQKLKQIAKQGNLPNLILVGPPGIGKTSSVLCLARQMLGVSYKDGVLELNASDERGIETVRESIKGNKYGFIKSYILSGFAQKKVNLEDGFHKIVILDEADSLTEGAQQALRMIISDYANSTRFVLSCNDSTKLIDAIQSRCCILRFSKLSDSEVLMRLKQICDLEHVQIDNTGYEALIFTAEGDMRQAINNLQATFVGYGSVNYENVLKVCDVPNVEVLKTIIECIQKGEFTQAQFSLKKVWDEGFMAYDITNTLNKLISNSDSINRNLQYEFLREMAFLKMRVLEGLPTFLQLSGFLAKCCKIAQQYNDKTN